MLFSRKTRGYFCGAIAAITYGLNPLFAKPLYAVGMSPEVVLTWRYGCASVILALIMLAGKKSFAMTGKQVISGILLGTTMALSSMTLYFSYLYMDSGAASTILFVYPVMVAALMAGFFHEKLSFITAGCILMSVAGVAILSIKGEGTTANDLFLGVLNSLLSALTYALYIVFVRESPAAKVPPLKLAFYNLMFGVPTFVVTFLIRVTCTDSELPALMPNTWLTWGSLACIAVIPTTISYFTTATAILLVGPTPTAILGALEPMTAVVVGVIVFSERMTVQLATGMCLILLAVLAIILKDRITKYIQKLQKQAD